MKYLIPTIICLLIFSSCKQKENFGIEFSDEYLSSHEWVIDSIYGSNEFIQDWLYFTPEKQFYRFSKHRKSYIIDSALTWKHNKILKANSELFKITAIDSQYIELESADKIYRAERWNQFDRGAIEYFISNNKYKLLINGKWKLDSTEIGKGGMPLNCGQIEKGSVFNFKNNGRLSVFEKDSPNYCNEFSYRINKERIALRKSDMIMELRISELNSKKLVLISKHIPRNTSPEKRWELKRKGIKLYLSKIMK